MSVCNNCGAISHSDPVTKKLRALTWAERRRLPVHGYAKEIRAHQERIVAKLWG